MANAEFLIRTHLKRVVYVFIGSTVLCLLTAGWMYLEGNVRGEPQPFLAHLLYIMPVWYPWAIYALIILWIVEHQRGPFWLRTIGHTILAIFMAYLHTGTRLLFHPMPQGHPESPPPETWLEAVVTSGTTEAPIHLFLYGAVLSVCHLIVYKRRLRERELATSRLETQLASAQMQALRAQLNPHFLFNAMNTISMLVRDLKQEAAVKTIAGLSELLRYVLDDTADQEIPLRQELEFVRRYLAIEQIRFQDRLQIKITADPKVNDALVPNLLLQPIVENAISHGIARSSAATFVSVHAHAKESSVNIIVTDDGPGFETIPPSIADSSVGIPNTVKRLAQLYGSEAKVEFSVNQPHGALVSITIPYHSNPISRNEQDL